MMSFIFATVALTVVYALALASADPWDLGIGGALSVCVLLAFRRFIFPKRESTFSLDMRRIVHFPVLAVAAAANIVRGTMQVTRVVLGLASARSAGFVQIPQGDRTDTGVVVSGLLDTLSPGSVLVDIDAEARIWAIHALQADDADAVRAELNEFYERFQRPVWP
jgi:multisubunit Na+/H+ antiporter MnhE subunit